MSNQDKRAAKVIQNGIFGAARIIGAYLLVMFLSATWVVDLTGYGRDSTDAEKRSGMNLHTDAETGCQYLSVPGGGVTPRMNNDLHMGCRK